MSYIGNVGDSNTSINSDFSKYTYEYIATAGQTTFTGTDINSAVLGYTVGNIIVSYGGADLAFSDYTATNGTSVVLADGALVGKILRVVAFEAFELADAYTKTQIDANTYTKTQIDANTYTQSQADTLLAAKATVANFTSTGIDDNATSNAITIDASENVGIGTASPSYQLEVENDGTYASLGMTSYRAAASPHCTQYLRAARGSLASPLALTSSDAIFNISGWGYDGDSFVNSGSIQLDTEGTIADNRIPTYMSFSTHADSAASGPVERMRIDSAGIVTKPYQAGFFARRSVGGDNRAVRAQEWAISGYGSYNTGNHFLTSNGRFTAPVAGVYSFAATPAYKQSNINLSWYFRINGGDVAEPVRFIGALNSHSTTGGSFIIKLAANDYVDINIDNLHHANTTYNYFCGHLIS